MDKVSYVEPDPREHNSGFKGTPSPPHAAHLWPPSSKQLHCSTSYQPEFTQNRTHIT